MLVGVGLGCGGGLDLSQDAEPTLASPADQAPDGASATQGSAGSAAADGGGAAAAGADGAAGTVGHDLLSVSAGASVHNVTSEYNSGTLAFNLLYDDPRGIWKGDTTYATPQFAVYELAGEARVTHVGVSAPGSTDWAAGQSVQVQLGAGPQGPWTDLLTTKLVLDVFEWVEIPQQPTGRYVRVGLPARASDDTPPVLVGDVKVAGSFLAPVPLVNVAGPWNGGWLLGTFRLIQDGASLKGCFADGRQLVGTVDGRVATLRFATAAGVESTAEFVLNDAPLQDALIQYYDDPSGPPTQAHGGFDRLDEVACTIEGEATNPGEVGPGGGAADPIEVALENTGKALIYDLLFDFNRSNLRAESGPVLDRIASLLVEHPDWRLSVEGHTDNVGGNGYNLRLSEERARATVAALIGRGVAAARLSAVGHGAGMPVADNSTSGGRARNRRVELVRQP